jgi:hypothetical protein
MSAQLKPRRLTRRHRALRPSREGGKYVMGEYLGTKYVSYGLA